MPSRRVIVAVALAAALTAYLWHWLGNSPPVIEPMDTAPVNTNTVQSPPRPVIAKPTTQAVSADQATNCALPVPSQQQRGTAADLQRLQQNLAKEPLLLAWVDDLSQYEANLLLAVTDD